MAMVEQAQAEAPIISRINRIDKVVKHLEEMRGRRSSWSSASSASSGSPSACSDARSSASLLDVKQCRPLDDVVSETQQKGTLLYRLSHLEERLLEMCLHLEKEIMQQHTVSKEEEAPSTPTKKGLKQLVKSCVKPKSKSKSKSK